MDEPQSKKRYDLEDRTMVFAREVMELVNLFPRTIPNVEIAKPVTRSAGSVGAQLH